MKPQKKCPIVQSNQKPQPPIMSAKKFPKHAAIAAGSGPKSAPTMTMTTGARLNCTCVKMGIWM